MPGVVGSVVRTSLLCGLELRPGDKVTARICCPSQVKDQRAPPEGLDQHPGVAHLGDPEACGISLVHDPVKEPEGLAALGQYPWLAILGKARGDFSRTNNNCLGSLIGPQVSSYHSAV